jgi:hypothetical protein
MTPNKLIRRTDIDYERTHTRPFAAILVSIFNSPTILTSRAWRYMASFKYPKLYENFRRYDNYNRAMAATGRDTFEREMDVFVFTGESSGNKIVGDTWARYKGNGTGRSYIAALVANKVENTFRGIGNIFTKWYKLPWGRVDEFLSIKMRNKLILDHEYRMENDEQYKSDVENHVKGQTYPAVTPEQRRSIEQRYNPNQIYLSFFLNNQIYNYKIVLLFQRDNYI